MDAAENADGLPPQESQPAIPLRRDGAGTRSLDPRVVALWRTKAMVWCSIAILATLAWAVPMWLFVGAVPKAVIPLPVLAAFALLWATVVWHPPKRYCHWSYRLDASVLELRFGVVWRTSAMIPLSRLQHIDVHRGPLDRHFGLASVIIHTAGTQDASHTVPGLPGEVAEALRDELLSHANLEGA
jgi:membrane protein YdbS with pleckstrin-like domain